eukprot:scaffold5368_cov206-Alexandrium_tamarense.AAC.16
MDTTCHPQLPPSHQTSLPGSATKSNSTTTRKSTGIGNHRHPFITGPRSSLLDLRFVHLFTEQHCTAGTPYSKTFPYSLSCREEC